MSETPDLPVGIKVQLAVRTAGCSDDAKATIVKTLDSIAKLNQTDRGTVLAVLKQVVGDDAVNDSDDVADELAQGAAALGVRKVRPAAA